MELWPLFSRYPLDRPQSQSWHSKYLSVMGIEPWEGSHLTDSWPGLCSLCVLIQQRRLNCTGYRPSVVFNDRFFCKEAVVAYFKILLWHLLTIKPRNNIEQPNCHKVLFEAQELRRLICTHLGDTCTVKLVKGSSGRPSSSENNIETNIRETEFTWLSIRHYTRPAVEPVQNEVAFRSDLGYQHDSGGRQQSRVTKVPCRRVGEWRYSSTHWHR
jgi:hypothetical protein